MENGNYYKNRMNDKWFVMDTHACIFKYEAWKCVQIIEYSVSAM